MTFSTVMKRAVACRSGCFQRLFIFSLAKYQTWSSRLRRGGRSIDCNQPPILSLPREILDMICTHLRIDDHISFRLFCRKFYLGRVPFKDLIKDLCWEISFDTEFAWLCIWEDMWFRMLGCLLCGGCRKYQPKEFFNAAEVTKQPRARRCFAFTSRISVTPDFGLSFMDLWSANIIALRRMGCSYYQGRVTMDTYNKCSEPYEWSSYVEPKHRDKVPNAHVLLLRGSKPDGAYMDYSFYVSFHGSGVTQITDAEIGTKVERSGFSLCPHVKSSDKRLLAAIHECMQCQKQDPTLSPSLDCHCCGMRSTILWDPERSRVNIKIKRRLGDLQDACDPQWLAVLDPPPIPIRSLRFYLMTRLRYVARSRSGARFRPERTCELKDALQHLNPKRSIFVDICVRCGDGWASCRRFVKENFRTPNGGI